VDNLTHSLFAATLGRTRLERIGRGTTAALLIASNAPDVDVIAAAHGGGLSYLQWHRGPTHGPLGVVGLGLATAAIVWTGRAILDRRRGRTVDGNATFAGLAAVSMFAVLLHLLMDFPTSYGTRLLSPFDWHWYTTDLMPIVDVYLLAVLAATFALGRRSPDARRRNAAIAIVFMAANYGGRAVLHHEAIAAAPRMLGDLPPLCDARAAAPGAVGAWPRDWRTTPPAGEGGSCLIEIAAMPDFLSPFRWRLIARFSNRYEVRDVDLLQVPEQGARLRGRGVHRVPDVWPPAALQAADRSEVARVFLGFSRFPAPRVTRDPGGGATVRWTDLRFGDGVPRRGQDPRTAGLFSATVRVGPDGGILAQRLGQ
jgi:membrane-bound metal-dependent hydrolase YbcI (DUF457 family)